MGRCKELMSTLPSILSQTHSTESMRIWLKDVRASHNLGHKEGMCQLSFFHHCGGTAAMWRHTVTLHCLSIFIHLGPLLLPTESGLEADYRHIVVGIYRCTVWQFQAQAFPLWFLFLVIHGAKSEK